MRPAPRSLSLAPDTPFKLVGGDLSLDFVNTTDWTRRGPAEDLLTDYDRVLEWAEVAGAITGAQAARLRARAAKSPDAAQRALDSARRVRWVLHCLFDSLIAGKRSPDVLEQFNALLVAMYQRLVLAWPRDGAAHPADAGAPALQWGWRDLDEHLESVLWPVVRAAAALISSEEAAKLRVCGGPDCGWMYVDRSRNGLRRWCEMSVCGTREKSRRRAVRRESERRPRRRRAGS